MANMNERLAGMLADRAAGGQSLFGDPVLNDALGWKPMSGAPKADGGMAAKRRLDRMNDERMARLLDAIIWSDESIVPPEGSIPWSQLGPWSQPGVPYPKNERGMPPSALNPYKLQPGDLEFLERHKPPPPRR